LAAVSYAAEGRDPEAELRATLEGYRRAFEREDVDELARYYAEFTDEQRAALRRYFRNAGDLRVQFDDIRIAIIGDQAAISFSREDHFVDRRSGDRQQVVVRVTKLFAKGAAGWQIVPEP
jgi:ketosteroid isomerase-like protein